MRTSTILKSFAWVLLLTSQAMSQYTAIESFDYAVGVSMDSSPGTAANGFAGAWTFDNGTAGLMSITDTGLHYGDFVNPITNIGNHITVANPGGWVAARYTRTLDKVWPDEAGKSYWTSFLFEASATPSGNTYYIVKLFSGTTELMAIGKGGGGTVYSCGSGWPGGSGADVSETQCEGEVPVWLVTRTVMSGDANAERTFMWINPDLSAEPDTAAADVKRNPTMNSGFDNIRLECGGEDAMQTNWDEIRLGTTWADVSTQVTAVTQKGNVLPVRHTLSQNYPNPFNPTTRIHYALKTGGNVRLSVMDLGGREVAVLVNQTQNAGEHDVQFSGVDLTSGMYFYRLQTASETVTRKMTLTK